jgi:flagellar hook-associated protein 3 FlgL
MSTRITTGMTQRNILAQLNMVNGRLTSAQAKMASQKQINRPSDDPYGTARAMTLRQNLQATTQYKRNADDAKAWADSTEDALADMSDVASRAKVLLTQGGSDSTDAASRGSLADEIDQLIQGVKQSANATYRGSYVFAGSQTTTAPYAMGADDTYKGDQAGLDPAQPGVLREIGPGVTMPVNTVAREFLGDGQTAGDGKLLDTLRSAIDALRADDAATLRDTELGNLDENLDTLLEVRARNGARTNRLDSALSRLSEVEESTVKQLSQTEDADIAKTLIDFNSQQAAYQSALRAGASLVQASLLDFLR